MNIAGQKRSFRIAGAIVVALMALAFGAATAQAGWSATATVAGSGPSADGTTIAGLQDGRTVIAWLQPSGGQPAVYGSRVDADGNAGPAVLLSTSGQAVQGPVVTVAPGGTATVAWVRTSGTNDIIQSNTLSEAGAAGTVVDRSATGPAGQDAASPKIVAAENGTVGMVWRKYDGSIWTIQSMVAPASGAPSAVQTYQPLGVDSGVPDIAAKASDSTFQLAWAVGSLLTGNIAFVPLGVDGTPGELDFLSISCTRTLTTDPYTCVPKPLLINPDSVHVGVDSKGAVNIVWRQYVDWAVHTNDPATDPPADFHMSALGTRVITNTFVNSATQPATPALTGGTTHFISAKTDVVSELSFAQGPGTDASVVWKNDVPGSNWIQTAKLGNTFDYWSRLPRLSNDVGLLFGHPQIAVGASGARAVTWTQESAVPGVPEMQVMRLTPEGLFVGPTSLAAPGANSSDHPAAHFAASGVSTVAFDMKDSGSTDVVALSRFSDPQINTFPDTVLFGGQLENVQSASRFISIVNPGSTSNEVTSITLGGADAGQFTVDASTCVKELTPEAVCQAEVKFKPTSSGLKTATVQVNSLAGNKVVNIQGNGIHRTTIGLKVKPATQALRKGKSVKVAVTLTNNGGIVANNLKVCQQGSKKVVRPAKKCKSTGSLAVGASRKLNFRIKLNGKAKKGTKYQVNYKLTVGNANSRIKYVKYALKGKKKKK